ncbi:GAF domain-containing protein, partial [Acinetobacter baumannii]
DERREWFKSRVGLVIAEVPRDQGFCQHTIAASDVMVVPDATFDPRFDASPLVAGEPRVRFYAGAPLVTQDGHAIGALCVL